MRLTRRAGDSIRDRPRLYCASTASTASAARLRSVHPNAATGAPPAGRRHDPVHTRVDDELPVVIVAVIRDARGDGVARVRDRGLQVHLLRVHVHNRIAASTGELMSPIKARSRAVRVIVWSWTGVHLNPECTERSGSQVFSLVSQNLPVNSDVDSSELRGAVGIVYRPTGRRLPDEIFRNSSGTARHIGRLHLAATLLDPTTPDTQYGPSPEEG